VTAVRLSVTMQTPHSKSSILNKNHTIYPP